MGLIEDDDVVLWEERTAAGDVESVVVMVGDDDVGFFGNEPCTLGEAIVAGRAASGSGALIGAHADRIPHVGGWGWIQFLSVARAGVFRPVSNLLDVVAGGSTSKELELFFVVRSVEFGQPLVAEVVAAPLEHSGRHVHLETLRDARYVVGHQLALERNGGGGDDGSLTGQDRRREVGQRLAGAGSGLDKQRSLVVDGLLDHLSHGNLPRTLLPAARESLGDCG